MCLQIYVSSSCFSSYAFLIFYNFSLRNIKEKTKNKKTKTSVNLRSQTVNDYNKVLIEMLTRLSTRRMFWSRTRLWSLSFFLWMAVIIIWIWSLSKTSNIIHDNAKKCFSIFIWCHLKNVLTDRERERFLWCFLDFLECFLFFEWWCWHSCLQGQKKKENFKNLYLPHNQQNDFFLCGTGDCT